MPIFAGSIWPQSSLFSLPSCREWIGVFRPAFYPDHASENGSLEDACLALRALNVHSTVPNVGRHVT